MSPFHTTRELQFGRVRACLRELCGLDELAVDADDTRTAIRLVDAVLVDADGVWPRPGQASALTAPERDRILAELWIRTFGPRIQGSPRCTGCGERYDTEFPLDALVTAVWPVPPPTGFALPDGRSVRVPTGADELAVQGPDAAATLAERIAPGCAPAEVAAVLEQGAPVLDLDLDAPCPECGAANTVGFRIQSYLLRALSAERARLPQQLHALARAYGWSSTEILVLPRGTRAQLVRLAEAAPARRSA